MPDSQRAYLYFQGGTLVLKAFPSDPAPTFRWIKAQWRCEAYHYPHLLDWLRANHVRDTVPRWEHPHLVLHDEREPHPYQREALKAWDVSERRGSIILPTGAGKTFVAIHAILQANCSTLVIAPTIDLLHQWYARLVNAFQTDIGVYYGGEKTVRPLTVTTYHSAGDLIAEQGNQFKLVIYDEVHHLPAPNWGETALMSPAPFRLGLTATYPEEAEQTDGRWRVDELIGPIVYRQEIDSLVGQQLAEYRTERIRIDLTPAERQQYDQDYSIYAGFFRSRALQRTHGPNWLMELNRLSAFDPAARRALLARRRLLDLLASAEGKFHVLEALLREYLNEQTLIFAENKRVAYAIARRYLVPIITAETKAAERKLVLDRFQNGTYRALVTCEVLNEGIDVPEAKVAIVLGGTSGAREYIQRLGRVLRKVENRKAVLFEVVARKTIEEQKAQARSRKQRSTHAHK
ncbi:MAG: DEAD/DEAH box helicase [Anaerolineae bacterium]|nr:DEAD/DEAH box helicase [Anaerolineae bacterium]